MDLLHELKRRNLRMDHPIRSQQNHSVQNPVTGLDGSVHK
jgi:hypothetical protein